AAIVVFQGDADACHRGTSWVCAYLTRGKSTLACVFMLCPVPSPKNLQEANPRPMAISPSLPVMPYPTMPKPYWPFMVVGRHPPVRGPAAVSLILAAVHRLACVMPSW